MMLQFVRNLFNYNERELRRIQPLVERVNSLEPEMRSLSDEALAGKTSEFRQALEAGSDLEALLPDAFAVVREAAQRTLDQRHFDVQIVGAVVLHEGKIAEMKTGEGKTLAATMPVYLNSLSRRGVHVVTVNDYLARRDAEWMGAIYRFLGLEVGVIVPGLTAEERQKAYAADITYGTNNEFGFDYLRDNMAFTAEQLVQRDLHYAILDEVDSILIDEARTPLIISGARTRSSDLYYKFARLVGRLHRERDYSVDEKARAVVLTEEGVARVEELLGLDNLYGDDSLEHTHYLNQALRAKELMKRDRDYVIHDGQVVIVDEFTGRLMHGRRYSDGLHQAIEAKESVKIQEESQTLATITFQNFFRMYDKLAGMTGTAVTEEEEFSKIYGLDVIAVPTNMPMIREDMPDAVYKTEEGKFRAVVRDIVERHERGQPVLVGTISIEKSEELSRRLAKSGVKHEVLNAKHHAREAEIVAKAGQPGAVTIATNMAGRGTDIVLGTGVAEKGGLHVLGTERHESRRIDNQLRGRSGRQGDRGSSQFYISLEDDLMRLFGGDLVASMMDRLGLDEDERIEHSLLSRAIENAQRKVESRNFGVRRHLLEYDDVMNEQRTVIYRQRRQVLENEDLSDTVMSMLGDVLDRALESFVTQSRYPEEWDLDGLIRYLESILFPQGRITRPSLLQYAEEGGVAGLREHLLQAAGAFYAAKEREVSAERTRVFERWVLLRVVDMKWMDHLAQIDDLREGIGLRAYGQRDPLTEFKFEAHALFEDMIASIQEDAVKYLFKLDPTGRARSGSQVAVVRESHRQVSAFGEGAGPEVESGLNPAGTPQRHATGSGGDQPVQEPYRRKGRKIGRNEPCPCGSGKKYKRCCGR